MEPKVVSEIDVFIGHFITPTIGKPVSINHAIPKFTYNLISEMISNTRMDYDDPQLQFLLDTMDGVISETSAAAMMKNWPILSNMLPNVKREKKYSEILLAYGKRHVDEHLTSIDTVTEPRDLIDRFLLHSKSLTNSDEPVFSCMYIKMRVTVQLLSEFCRMLCFAQLRSSLIELDFVGIKRSCTYMLLQKYSASHIPYITYVCLVTK